MRGFFGLGIAVGVLLGVAACTTQPAATNADGRTIDPAGGTAADAAVPTTAAGAAAPTTAAPDLPTAVNLDGKTACDLVTLQMAMTVGGIGAHGDGDSRNNWGSVCSYEGPGVFLFALLTDGPDQGIAQLPTSEIQEGEITSLQVGRFPARQERFAAECSLDVEVVPGRVLRVSYFAESADADQCATATALATQALRHAA